MAIPRSVQMQLSPEYGSPAEILAWEPIDEPLRDAAQCWGTCVRPDARPHVVPRDGVWSMAVLPRRKRRDGSQPQPFDPIRP